ncbi:unnamed protein product [Agarophyton chilense]|eukprot:gb/GEZJ01001492.1/.p1 GENE.gb/GEZJ01001492.1/~~gb/GEZJ01001492.1/.p1  ORF type:complete len:165 (-),score=27.83 gb/GEZJ01001492.1/:3307-3801(-)
MIGIFMKLGLLFISANNSLQTRRRKHRAGKLLKFIQGKEKDISDLTGDLERSPAFLRYVLRLRDRKGKIEEGKWKRKERQLKERLGFRIQALKEKLETLRRLDPFEVAERVQEWDSFLFVSQQKIAHHDRLVGLVEEWQECMEEEPTMAMAGRSTEYASVHTAS